MDLKDFCFLYMVAYPAYATYFIASVLLALLMRLWIVMFTREEDCQRLDETRTATRIPIDECDYENIDPKRIRSYYYRHSIPIVIKLNKEKHQHIFKAYADYTKRLENVSAGKERYRHLVNFVRKEAPYLYGNASQE